MALPSWAGVAAVLAVQTLVLASIPARALTTRARGRDVTLWTEPVDPYDLMSGYYVTLTYEAERAADKAKPDVPRDGDVWVTVRRGEPAWTPVSVAKDRPAPSPDTVSMRARWTGWRAAISNGGRVYIPETERERATDLLRDAKGRGLVDLKVDDDGDVSVLRLRVGDATFGE